MGDVITGVFKHAKARQTARATAKDRYESNPLFSVETLTSELDRRKVLLRDFPDMSAHSRALIEKEMRGLEYHLWVQSGRELARSFAGLFRGLRARGASL